MASPQPDSTRQEALVVAGSMVAGTVVGTSSVVLDAASPAESAGAAAFVFVCGIVARIVVAALTRFADAPSHAESEIHQLQAEIRAAEAELNRLRGVIYQLALELAAAGVQIDVTHYLEPPSSKG